ncbi:MAG: aminoglycoside phosphotransferase family protein [Dysgonomonas sp.]
MPLANITKQFQFEGTVETIKPLTDGLINDTFLLKTQGDSPDYILQRKNKKIFKEIPAMMENILKVESHLKNKIIAAGGDPEREALTLIKTNSGKLYYIDNEGEYWTACLFIDNTVSYLKADSLELAEQGGKGIGMFQAMLSDMEGTLTDILPGFHNIRFRLDQWDKVLEKDPVGRKSQVQKEINVIEKGREEMLAFWHEVESGKIPIRVTHNDTKISNILFDKQTNDVLCVIDLDTVLSSTCLNDYGDAIRSYANASVEDDENLNNVYLRMDMFEAYTKGYLSQAVSFLTPNEIKYIAFSAKYITYEQALRFLMDYIDGDNYYKINSEIHNLVRTRAQIKLLQSMEEHYNDMCAVVERLVEKSKK